MHQDGTSCCDWSTQKLFLLQVQKLLTSPMWLHERLMLVRAVFWARTREKSVAVGSDSSLPARLMDLREELLSKAWPMACPPSSSMQLRRKFKDISVAFLARAWAIAWAPGGRIWLLHRVRISSLLWFISLPMALAPRSPIRLWEKSSSTRHGWSNKFRISSRALSSSTLLRVSLKTCRRKRTWHFFGTDPTDISHEIFTCTQMNEIHTSTLLGEHLLNSP